MAVTTIDMPTRIYNGIGALEMLAKEGSTLGKKALIVTTGKDMEKFALLGKVTDQLAGAGIASSVFDEVTPNPKTSEIEAGVRYYKEEGCDFLISLGGGSSIDAAKNISMCAANGASIHDFLPQGGKVGLEERRAIPHIAIPTTAGTGSEATKTAVVSNDRNRQKYGVRHDCIYPTVSIVDPELMLTVPKSVTADTGIDVFFHAMEGYLSNKATRFSDMVALESMRLVREELPRVCQDGSHLESRASMAWASTLGGIALDNAICVGIHGLGQPAGGYVDAVHGKSLCAVYYSYMKYTWKSDISRYAEVARILGGSDGAETDEELAAASADRLRDFIRPLGLEIRLGDLGIEESMIPAIAESVLDTTRRTLECCKMEIGYDDIVSIYKDAL
jgi:alcohol dehydrogenase